MENCTLGFNHHPGRVVDLKTTTGCEMEPSCENSFRLFVVECGSALVKHCSTHVLVEAPAVFCIKNSDSIELVDANALKIRTLYFKPKVINECFGNRALTEQEIAELTLTERQDYRWLDPFCLREPDASHYVKLGPDSMKRVSALVDQLTFNLEEQTDVFWPCRSRSFLLEILFIIHNMRSVYDEFKVNLKVPNDHKFMEILFYLHSHYRDRITLAQLATNFNSNRTTINNLFSQHTGESVMNYLRNLRVSLACLILRDTMRPVQEIAELSGFSDITNFGRQFKKAMNCSPTDYRNEHSWML